MKRIIVTLLMFLVCLSSIYGEDGYKLWLRYEKVNDTTLLGNYKSAITNLILTGSSETAEKYQDEIKRGLKGLFGTDLAEGCISDLGNSLIIGNIDELSTLGIIDENKFTLLDDQGFVIKTLIQDESKNLIISGRTDIAVLYGVFKFLNLLQQHKEIGDVNISSSPKIKYRLLNHWDGLDRTSERGYAGFSIWDWHRLPDYIIPQYEDYARANASIGVNGTVLTNVNANAFVLTPYYLKKAAALADVFRPYGIKVYLSARFSAPMEIGGISTADPRNDSVKTWWNDKIKEIYEFIPDFGGFIVKANSEGQPGPGDYDRTHAEGANMLADALKPFGGIVMWRAFVYSHDNTEDRAKQAYTEFTKLDGEFRDNVSIQVKNGAIDFQPREPFHPLFGALPHTSTMMEFQITQEYLGQATQLVFLAPMWKEVLDSDTYAKGKGSTVAKVIDGSVYEYKITGMAGVSNIGTARNWTGHEFGQANWYAFGKLAWDHDLSSETIADEWIRMTFSDDENVIEEIKSIMLKSHEAAVNYMTPLGLHHIMGWNHHYGPSPWIKDKHRADWTSVYYHKADKEGIGFDRTKTGSDAVSQYFPEVAEKFNSLEDTPEKYLLWFHHVNWNYKLESGNTLWDELCYKYYAGVDTVRAMRAEWDKLENHIDKERFIKVKMLLKIQEKEAVWWRNACLLYFQTFSNMPIPEGLERPDKSLEYYENLKFPYAPGIKPSW